MKPEKKPEIEEQVELDDNRLQTVKAGDLEVCRRYGEPVESIIWGQTTCPRCGLHFECC